jgi:hypothetical protein
MAKKDPNRSGGKDKPPPAPPVSGASGEAAARKRVALLRHKLEKALDDPLMRDQVVRAIRAMMVDSK